MEGIDEAALLAPIPGAADPREDLSPAAPYYRLRDARAEARAAERAADAAEAAEPPPPQWATVRRLAIELLTTSAKDLEAAAWLAEALLRGDGLAGLAAGLGVMAGLVEAQWDALFPMPDEEGIARRAAPVAGLNGEGAEGTLIQPLRKLALFARPDGTPLALWQYEQSAALAGIGDAARRQARIDAGVLAFETVEAEARAAAAGFAVLRRDAAAAAAAWGALAAALEARAGAAAPSTGRVRDLLSEILGIAERYAPDREAAGDDVPAADGPAATGTAEPVGDVAGRESALRATARDDALRALADIAQFFRRTEPHSPLAYTLEEAVRRARLTWPELLAEIVPDADGRAAILVALGIRPPSRAE